MVLACEIADSNSLITYPCHPFPFSPFPSIATLQDGHREQKDADQDPAVQTVRLIALHSSFKQPNSSLTLYGRDLDQIKADLLSPKHLKQYKDTKLVEDLPGLGRHYCIECAKWYDMEATLVAHRRGKPHKRR